MSYLDGLYVGDKSELEQAQQPSGSDVQVMRRGENDLLQENA
jgi:hypothetical protein